MADVLAVFFSVPAGLGGDRVAVVVIARDGTEATAATWVVPQAGGQPTTINGSASIPDNDIAAIAIRDHTD